MSASRLAVLVCFVLPVAAVQEVRLPLVNGGFEDGLTGWTVNDTMCRLATDQVATGRQSLKVVDASPKDGSDTRSAPVAVSGGRLYYVRGKVCPVSGSGLGIYVQLFDAAGKVVGDPLETHRGAPSAPVGKWSPFEIMVPTVPAARSLAIWIHSYSAAVVSAYLDDFEVVERVGPIEPPWTPQYKLRAGDTARLTAADVVGPDGLVYPNWTRAGVPGGIPQVPVKVKAVACGAVPNTEADSSPALQRAIDQAAAGGGGAVWLAPGTYQLDSPLRVRDDHLVLRGAGRELTRLVFRFGLGPDGIRFLEPTGDELCGDSVVVFGALPQGLDKLELLAGDKRVNQALRHAHWGNTFSLRSGVGEIFKAAGAGATTVTLKAVATYQDGRTRTAGRTMRLNRAGHDPADRRRAPHDVALSFSGSADWWRSKRLKLTADGRRGQQVVSLESTEGLHPGDWLQIDGPATERWKKLTANACLWGTYRRNLVQVVRLDGSQVTLSEPLRIDFPVIDGAAVWKVDLLEGCGIEDLTIEQTQDLWVTTVQFTAAHGCWARGVTVKKCGRNPVYGQNAKQCTITNCLFDDAWFKGGGGTAYAGWEASYDCLMTDCETRRLRHAPLVQWSAAGNVIRRSTFHDSDAQWHSGWTNENLFEQCTVTANTGNGGYGYGAWASPPEDDAHGPNGPRNVVYNCDFHSPRTGLWMGGMNEGWLILYNRFVAASGNGIYTKSSSFDHTWRGNVFVLQDTKAPCLVLATPDCLGVEAVDNLVYGGNGRLVGGVGQLALDQGNQVKPFQADAPRPQPAVASIYEWQLAHAAR